MVASCIYISDPCNVPTFAKLECLNRYTQRHNAFYSIKHFLLQNQPQGLEFKSLPFTPDTCKSNIYPNNICTQTNRHIFVSTVKYVQGPNSSEEAYADETRF